MVISTKQEAWNRKISGLLFFVVVVFLPVSIGYAYHLTHSTK